jgi:hypothetical protein
MTHQDVVEVLSTMVDMGLLVSYSDVYVDDSVHVSFTTSPTVRLTHIDIKYVSAGTQPAREQSAKLL